MKTTHVKWVEGNMMVGTDSKGNSIVVGFSSDREPQWSGVRASDLLMISAASCSTHDVANILTKQKQPLQSIDVKVDGEQMTDPPYKFTKMHLHFIVKGDIPAEKVAKAIELSEEKYCSVINTLKASVEITTDFEVIA
jgi:putative redox protein